ncbi:MAG: hypothetical protein RIE59_02645 [Imperialibacter sp.]
MISTPLPAQDLPGHELTDGTIMLMPLYNHRYLFVDPKPTACAPLMCLDPYLLTMVGLLLVVIGGVIFPKTHCQ